MQEYATISVLCPDPWFYDVGDDSTIFSGIQPAFEFPFSNESLSDRLLTMGEIWLDTSAVLNYEGTIDTGIVITVHAFGQCEHLYLYNVDTNEQIYINTDRIRDVIGSGIQANDDIIISTVKSHRYCRLLRNGVYYNIIGALGKDTDWFQISNGTNLFGFKADNGENNISVSFSYRNTYMGV